MAAGRPVCSMSSSLSGLRRFLTIAFPESSWSAAVVPPRTIVAIADIGSPDDSAWGTAAGDAGCVSSQLKGLGLGFRAVVYAPSRPRLARRLARAAGEAFRLPIAALYRTPADA
jgi:hypothetical protein